MFDIIKKMTERKARHIKEVYDTEINPEVYLRCEMEIRNKNIKEAISAVVIIFLVCTFVKLWFVCEGFSIQW